MAIYDKNRNMLILADNELSINNLLTKEEVYQLGFDAGYDEGYEAGMEECEIDYSKKYLTIEVQYDGLLDISSGYDRFFRINGGEWLPANGNIEVSDGDKIELKAYGAAPNFFNGRLNSACTVYGNIMSLFYGDDFENKKVFPETDSNCTEIFYGCSGLTDASNLILPATALTPSCYNGMFWACRNLKYGPKILPATTLTDNCYAHMFSGCYELLEAPELPATILAEMCYFSMFTDCFKLEKAPVLPATTLAERCYQYMFYMIGQTPRLNYVKCLATDLSANRATFAWIFGVSQTGTFIKTNGTSWPTGANGIPEGWTVVDAEL